MSKVQVAVEVTSEVRTGSSGNRQQVAYVDLGGKYPEEVTLYVNEKGPLQPGHYFADRLYKKGYAIQLDLFSLKRLPGKA